MALQKCEECAKDISSKADVCPHCGCPTKSEEPKAETGSLGGFLKDENKEVFIEIFQRTKKFTQRNRNLSKIFSLILGIVFGIMSYVPEHFLLFQDGSSYNRTGSFRPFFVILACAFIFIAYIIHTKKWPPEE